AARTSSSSCLIIVPIRMTLAGCSTMLPTPRSSSPSSVGTLAMPTGRPSGPTTITCCSPFSPCSGLTSPSFAVWPTVGRHGQQHLSDDPTVVEQRVGGRGLRHRQRGVDDRAHPPVGDHRPDV